MSEGARSGYATCKEVRAQGCLSRAGCDRFLVLDPWLSVDTYSRGVTDL